MIRRQLFYLLLIVSHTLSQDIRSMHLSKLTNIIYQCNTSDCLSSTVVSTAGLQNCKIACLNNGQCRTVTFDSNNNQCEIFVNIPSENGNLFGLTYLILCHRNIYL